MYDACMAATSSHNAHTTTESTPSVPTVVYNDKNTESDIVLTIKEYGSQSPLYQLDQA